MIPMVGVIFDTSSTLIGLERSHPLPYQCPSNIGSMPEQMEIVAKIVNSILDPFPTLL
jgi:hypothetical protein